MTLKVPTRPYKNENGVWLTSALFHDRLETIRPEDRVYQPVFSLHTERPGMICCRTTFVSVGDPTGYKWALQYLGDMEHWYKLMKAKWFEEAVEEWRKELMLRLKSEAVEQIYRIAMTEGSKSQLPAARFLAEMDKPAHGRGRPSKAEMDAELKKAVKLVEQEDEDLERIGLTVIQGGKSAVQKRRG